MSEEMGVAPTHSTVTDLANSAAWCQPGAMRLHIAARCEQAPAENLERLRLDARLTRAPEARAGHSTVTDFARFLGLSTSVPRAHAAWYASSCSGTTCRIGDSRP